ncbi:efflux RND transporter periplasmic adaptor subunit [Roseateles sp. DB2]|uniref:efflux RND transporter periplasmic adaptor subunit n=1 Tax=Roseateles sp. DB2 TaxID=3453717 RepID=UPI003EEE33AF
MSFHSLRGQSLAVSRSAMPLRRQMLAGIAAALLTTVSPASAEGAKPPASMAVTPAQLQSLGVRLQALHAGPAAGGLLHSARVQAPPQSQRVLSSGVGGLVEEVMVQEQDLVRAGQPLLRLQSPEFAELQLRWMEAQSREGLSATQLRREQRLFEEGVIPERRLQEARVQAEADRARLQQASAALKLGGGDAALMQRLRQGGAPEPALLLRAPVAAQVESLEVRPGQRVRDAEVLLRLNKGGEAWLELAWPAGRQPELAVGAELQVPGRDIVARVSHVGGVVGESQTLPVRARVVKGGERLRPGELLQVRLPSQAPGSAWSVPAAALVRHEGKAYVFVREAQGFRVLPVTVLGTGAEAVQLGGDLQAGQQIAVSGLVALKAAWLGLSGGE